MSKKIRVLLVDDEELFVNNMARILKSRGFEVTTAFSGYQAVDAVKYGGGFDVVVLDVKMPGMDGVETLGEIKKRAPDTEVIMLTGHATLESGTGAMRKGAYDYLMKPCDIEDLVEKIKEAHEAEMIKRHPVLWPRRLVREIPLGTFVKLHPEAPITDALDAMGGETGVESLEEVHVLDKEDRLQGVVTRRNILTEAQRNHPEMTLTWPVLLHNPHLLPEKPLREVLRPQVVSTPANAYLTDAAHQMIQHNLRRMPVVRAGKMIGVIRLEDVFQYMDREIE
ncbi:MAG: response regulator [Deltaproteobacteria bacterium]|nr:response regulator [Deltaproteobacteria bacterium]